MYTNRRVSLQADIEDDFIEFDGTKKDEFIEVFEGGIADGYEYCAVVFLIPGNKREEIIINHKEDFKNKLEYYKQTYDYELRHKYNDDVMILRMAFENDIESLIELANL